MNTSIVLDKLAQHKTAFGTSLHLTDPALFEMASSLGLDAIWLDLEHHAPSDQQASELIRAARAGGQTDIVVRPAKGEFARMARLLEAGAHGVMYPRCESPEEAAEVVRWAKFAPLGQRGFDGAGADSDYMSHSMIDYLQRANANTFVIIQVEDERAVERCDEIIRVEGVDMLMLGPADFSILSGRPGEFSHSSVEHARSRIAEVARAAGKQWASTSGSISDARQLAEMGAGLVFCGNDLVLLRREIIAMRDEFSAMVGTSQ